jgi:anaerobic magnesium-protoporphyrin IX monomethyl ester cyclase
VKVLLLNPPAYRGVRFVREGRCGQRLSSFQYNMVPISLISTAALLRERGHEVALTEAIARDLSIEEVLGEIGEFSPALVLVNTSTVSFRGDADAAAQVKKALPGAFVAAYGTHVTALPEESLKESAFDGVIRREPEATGAALADALAAGGPLEEVTGLSFRRDWSSPEGPGPIISNPDRPFIEDLDSLPFPARDLVDHSQYPAPLSQRPHTLVSTSRGCPYPCVFCTARLYYGTRLRLRSPESVGEEIGKIVEEEGLDLFTFWSDTFTLNREHVVAICREILKRKLIIDWMCNSRVDRVDLDLLRLMAAAGCRVISFGVESGSQAVLDNVKKGITVEQVEQAFAWCRQAGIKSAAHLILGLPGETRATIRETARLSRRIGADYVQFYGAVPFPGTDFYRQAREKGWLLADSWDDFEINRDIVSTPDLSVEELRKCRRRAFLSFYFRPSYIAARLAEVRGPSDLGRLAANGWSFVRHWVFSADRS